MFYVHGIQGRGWAQSLDEVRRLSPASAVARVRDLPGNAPGGASAAGPGGGRRSPALQAYAQGSTPPVRATLSQVGELMSRPAITVPLDATAGDAWRTLQRHRVRQAAVLAADGALVGLIGHAELLPGDRFASEVTASSWAAVLARPVASLMWTPVPSATPATSLRQAAGLMLATGLPGLPVCDEAGPLLGFVSRSDLLRAMMAEPPLDLWG